MWYCVVKDSIDVIDSGQSNNIMLQNAINTDFKESEIEILTEEQFQARLELEPKPIELPSESERIEMLENMLLMIMEG